ncbi:uncharacterized protein PG986_003300 [Apiospora aurea]|uniref:EthD domain-containing protein n=1 Tax=Apiospora aurea TaxID=335848 RepID=A0ABR1QR90_9PEZI
MAEVSPKHEGQPLKFTITHYRLPQHTHEAFIQWLTEEHLPLALPVLKKHGALGYSLFVTPGPLNDGLRELYKDKDQDQWVDVPKALVSLGHHVPYLVEGEVVNMPK